MSQETLSDYITVVAEQIGMPIPPECEAGVRSNVELLLLHAAVVAGADDTTTDPAEALRL